MVNAIIRENQKHRLSMKLTWVLVTSANDFKREFDIFVPFEDKRCMVLLAKLDTYNLHYFK
jgi:hypothetical protein